MPLLLVLHGHHHTTQVREAEQWGWPVPILPQVGNQDVLPLNLVYLIKQGHVQRAALEDSASTT